MFVVVGSRLKHLFINEEKKIEVRSVCQSTEQSPREVWVVVGVSGNNDGRRTSDSLKKTSPPCFWIHDFHLLRQAQQQEVLELVVGPLLA